MKPIKHISIHQPCNQRWENMEPRMAGRHCQLCSKTVVDFTRRSNDEILHYLVNQGNVCGKFSQFQMNSLNNQVGENVNGRPTWKKLLAATAVISALSFARTYAKPIAQKTEQAPDRSKIKRLQGVPDSARTIRVTGTVVASDDKLPVPGASVRIKGTNIGAMVGQDGCFTLIAPDSAKTLVVSFIGYQTQEVAILPTNNREFSISMVIALWIMGEVMVVRQPFLKRVYYRFIKRPIRKLFN